MIQGSLWLWSSFSLSIIWVNEFLSGALQLMLRHDMTSVTSMEEASRSNRVSCIGRKVKSGWLSGLGKLNLVCATVMEKPMAWRRLPSWSIGFMCPWNGHGTSTNLRSPHPCFSISSSLWKVVKDTGLKVSTCLPEQLSNPMEYRILEVDQRVKFWYTGGSISRLHSGLI